MPKVKSIAVIGAGYLGLTAAYFLQQAGFKVTVFEASKVSGGLAAGFLPEKIAGQKQWRYALEKHYHHVFTTDKDLISFLKKISLENELFFKRVITKTLYKGKLSQLDSPLSLLRFPNLSFISKIRTAILLTFLKIDFIGVWLEHFAAEAVLTLIGGLGAWEILWQPLFEGKFGKFKDKINAAWFWARIHARSSELGYAEGGFGGLSAKIVDRLKQLGVRFSFGKKIKLKKTLVANGFEIDGQIFDQVLFTGPAPALINMLGKEMINSRELQKWQRQILSLQSLGARTMVLECDQPFFKDRTYWLNINEKNWPFLCVVEHTNLVDRSNYANKYLVYVGKYLPSDGADFAAGIEEVWQKYLPFLERLSPDIVRQTKRKVMHTESFAQPLVFIDHSRNVPLTTTPINNLYWASMQHVYPFDRGINYAVAMGKKVAEQIIGNSKILENHEKI